MLLSGRNLLLDMDKYFYIKRKALSNRECEHIIKLFEKSDYRGGNHDYYSIHPRLIDSEYSFLKSVLEYSLNEYCKKNTFLGKRYDNLELSLSWSIDPMFNIQKYDPGHYYDSQCDVEYWEGHCEHGRSGYDAKRIVAWMFYLNDIKKDGGTHWPQQKFTSKPRAGDLYIWPAGWTHSHYGIPAPKETKYIITGWCRWN